MIKTTGYTGKVTKIKGKKVSFASGATHHINNFSFAINVGDIIMIDSHGSIWKKV